MMSAPSKPAEKYSIFAVPVGMGRVGGFCGKKDAPQCERAGHHVDDGFQCIRKDGGGLSQTIDVKLERHQQRSPLPGERVMAISRVLRYFPSIASIVFLPAGSCTACSGIRAIVDVLFL